MNDQTTLSEAASPASEPDGGKGVGAETGSALLTRLRNYRVTMDPHHRSRAGGKLLIEAIEEIERLQSYKRFEGILQSHGLIDPCAVEDPEGFDNYRTHGAIRAAHAELISQSAERSRCGTGYGSRTPQLSRRMNPPIKSDSKRVAGSSPLPCSACAECGMTVWSNEYHPYAACLMFKACRDAGKVHENLAYVREDTEIVDYLATMWNSQGSGHHIMGRRFANPTGSFRDAIRQRMIKQNDQPS